MDRLPTETWPDRRRAAMSRLLAVPGIDAGDLAQALGVPRREAGGLKRAFGPPGRRAAAPGLGDLGAALRAHIGRQIAALDARLTADAPDVDSAKVLRDLGGLKRLLDELTGTTRKNDRNGDADGEPEEDLAVLRDRIARRYAAFAPDWAERGLRGELAADAPEHARP